MGAGESEIFRQTVRGQGKLEKMTVAKSDVAPTGVTIANWEDGAKVFASMFAEMSKQHVEPKPPQLPALLLR